MLPERPDPALERALHATAHGLGEPTAVIVRLPATVLHPIDAGRAYEFVVRREELRFFDPASGGTRAPVELRS